jgi:hypothetical protein
MVVCGRISSSWFRSSTPFWSVTGMIDFLKYLLSHAALARFWLSTA